MGAGAKVVGVPAAFLIGHDVGAVLQHHTHAFDAYRVAIKRVGQIALRAVGGKVVAVWVVAVLRHGDAPHQNGGAAVKVFAHQHAGSGNVGCNRCYRLRGVVRRADLRARANRRNISHRGGSTGGHSAQTEGEMPPVSAHQRVGQDDRAQTSRTTLVPEAQRHAVCDAQTGNCQCATVDDGQRVGHEFANRHSGLAGRLGDLHTGSGGRVQRNVDPQGRAIDQGEVLATRSHDQHKRRARQRLKRRVGHCGGEGIPRWWRDLKAVGTSCHARELVAAWCKVVKLPTGVSHTCAAGDGGRVGTDTVVAEHLGGQTGGHIDHGDLHAVDGQTGQGVKKDTKGVYQGGVGQDRRTSRAVLVLRLDAHVASDVQSAVVGSSRRQGGLDEADKHAGGGAGFSEREGFAVAAAGSDRCDHRLRHQGVLVLVVIGDAHEHRIAPGIHLRLRQGRCAGQGQRAGARYRGRWQVGPLALRGRHHDGRCAHRAWRIPQEFNRRRSLQGGGHGDGAGCHGRRGADLVAGAGGVGDRRAGRGGCPCVCRKERQ